VPEMFGAETLLMDRCENEALFQKTVRLINDFKGYFESYHMPVYENPTPGNKAGGITTLEDKSCGCVQKGGSAQVVDVLEYAEPVTKKGLNLLSGPGNDLVSATDLTAAGAHIILFTTGRGTPFGAPAPTVKISTNTALYEKKGNWIDFNAGTVAQGEDLDHAGDRLLDFVLEIASGKKTKAEERGAREIAIFKDGVTL
jgi:D-altronate dehydratase (EC 4.2.1.7)